MHWKALTRVNNIVVAAKRSEAEVIQALDNVRYVKLISPKTKVVKILRNEIVSGTFGLQSAKVPEKITSAVR